MSHVPTVLKSDRSVFDKMLPVDDNDLTLILLIFFVQKMSSSDALQTTLDHGSKHFNEP